MELQLLSTQLFHLNFKTLLLIHRIQSFPKICLLYFSFPVNHPYPLPCFLTIYLNQVNAIFFVLFFCRGIITNFVGIRFEAFVRLFKLKILTCNRIRLKLLALYLTRRVSLFQISKQDFTIVLKFSSNEIFLWNKICLLKKKCSRGLQLNCKFYEVQNDNFYLLKRGIKQRTRRQKYRESSI